MTLRDLYRAYGEVGDSGTQARQLLDQLDWFASLAEFDPRTGEALPLGLDELLRRLEDRASAPAPRDRLWRVVEHSRMSIERIFTTLSENPSREQAMLPIRSVKELNAASFIALSRRPGRNIREKLADKPYMQAVRRYQSVDLPQNRLFKDFVTTLAELLEFRLTSFGHEDPLIDDIRRWLRSDQAQAISRWENLPPNNTLLSHRDYRRIWDAWRWLQEIDRDTEWDLSQVATRAQTVAVWEHCRKLYSDETTLFADMPVLFDYQNFTVKTWGSPCLHGTAGLNRSLGSCGHEVDPVCIDLTYVRPRFAILGSTSGSILNEAFVWQRWTGVRDSVDQSVDINLARADGAFLHPDAATVASADLFFDQARDESLLDSAAQSFSRRLGGLFSSPVLLWLVPDFLNDFQLQVVRRNLNARFREAEPVPRSIAAVFEQIDHSVIRGRGFKVVVVDSVGGVTYATKLVAEHDAELEKRVPESRGFYWERSPHVLLDRYDAPRTELSEIPYVDADGGWHDASSTVHEPAFDEKALREHPDVGSFQACIRVSENTVFGGLRLHELQQRAGGIPIWRDHIPELSIKASKNERYQRLYLVDRGTTIRPLRGRPVPIPVHDLFTLPEGPPFYEFPLFQGQDPDDLGYVARLESPDFPLVSDTTYRLEMTYTYGADDPYRLVFRPLDESLRPVQAKWEPKVTHVVEDAPAPQYPGPLSWDQLRTWPDPQGEPVDLLKWLEESLSTLAERTAAPSVVTLASHWRSKFDGQGNTYWYAFAERNDGASVYCNSKHLAFTLDEDPNQLLPIGTELFARIRQTSNGGLTAQDLALQPGTISEETRLWVKRFRDRSLQNRMAAIWSDGRSLDDADCPRRFRQAVLSRLEELRDTLPPDLFQQKLMVPLSFMHKDAPVECTEWLSRQARSRNVEYARSVGSCLGTLGEDWQRRIFNDLVANPSRFSVSALSFAIWREEHLVEHFSVEDLAALLAVIHTLLGDIQPYVPRPTDRNGARKWVRTAAEPMELLLGLIRTRESSDHDVHMALQPHQDITRRLGDAVERVADFVAASSLTLHSRVRLSDLPPKPDGERTPDLLYALRLYLTGDSGANAIRVTGIDDGEDE